MNTIGLVVLMGTAVMALLIAFVLRLDDFSALTSLTRLRRMIVVCGVVTLGLISFAISFFTAATAIHGLFRLMNGHWAGPDEPIREPLSLGVLFFPLLMTIAISWWFFPRMIRALEKK